MFGRAQYPLQLFIFPEGTDLSQSNREKGWAFAEQAGKPKYYFVLHPRKSTLGLLSLDSIPIPAEQAGKPKAYVPCNLWTIPV